MGVEGEFRTVDGELFNGGEPENVFHWAEDEPSGHTSNQGNLLEADCAHVGDSMMYAFYCDAYFRGICERLVRTL